jgi:hypothetical protein
MPALAKLPGLRSENRSDWMDWQDWDGDSSPQVRRRLTPIREKVLIAYWLHNDIPLEVKDVRQQHRVGNWVSYSLLSKPDTPSALRRVLAALAE